MPRTAIAIVTVPRNGGVNLGAGTAGDAANDHSLANDLENVKLLAKNTGAGAQTLTIVTAYTVDGLAVDDVSQSIPAGETWEFGPFPKSIYGQPADSFLVHINVAENTWTFWASKPA